MSRFVLALHDFVVSFPRVSGDEPPRIFTPSWLAEFSPRERG